MIKPGGPPRECFPALPERYRKAWHDDPLPAALCQRTGLPERTTLGELDQSIWRKMSRPENSFLLERYVLATFTNRILLRRNAGLLRQPILVGGWRPEVDPAGLPFAVRCWNVLTREGKLKDLRWLAEVTPGEFLELGGAGPATLLDFASVAEACGATGKGNGSGQPPEWDSPPWHPAKRVDSSGGRRQPARARTLSWKRKLERELQESEKEPLDRVLLRILALLAPQHKEGLAMRLGWDGHGGCTLRKAGDFLGISRERVRQLQRGLQGKTSSVLDFPVLDRAIRRLERVAEKLEDDPDRIFCEEGITSIPFHPQGVLSAARMFGRSCRLEMQDGGRWVAFRDDPRFRPLSEFLARLPEWNHVCSVGEIMARLGETGTGLTADLIRSYLQTRKGLVRLDKAGNWFWEGRSSIHLNLARKLLFLRSPMDLDTLCEGVLRSHRSRRRPLPSAVLAGLFRAAGLRVESGKASLPGKMRLANPLTRLERILVGALRRNGNVMHVQDLRKKCLPLGLKRSTLAIFLTYSPLVVRQGCCVYSLRGFPVDSRRTARLLGRKPRWRRHRKK